MWVTRGDALHASCANPSPTRLATSIYSSSGHHRSPHTTNLTKPITPTNILAPPKTFYWKHVTFVVEKGYHERYLAQWYFKNYFKTLKNPVSEDRINLKQIVGNHSAVLRSRAIFQVHSLGGWNIGICLNKTLASKGGEVAFLVCG